MMGDDRTGADERPEFNRLRPEERYHRDPTFAALVDVMEAAIHRAEYTPTELREAAMLAAVRYETRNWRVAARLDGASIRVFSAAPFRPGSRAFELFHRAWTRAVGTPGYDRAEWVRMETALNEAAQTM
jgi:hypothetical protein